MQPSPDPAVRRRPPVAAILAAPLAVLSAVAVAFFGILALAFSEGDLTGDRWLFVAVPALLAVVLLVGALLLMLARSWLALFLPAGALSLVVVAAILYGALGDGTGGFLTLTWLLPGVAALSSVLPGTRRWVAARKDARRAGRRSVPADLDRPGADAR